MFHYPMTSAVLGSSLNMILLSVLFILSWFRFFLPRDEALDKFSEQVILMRSISKRGVVGSNPIKACF